MAIGVLDDLAGEYPGDLSIRHLVARTCAMRDRMPGADWDAVSRLEVK